MDEVVSIAASQYMPFALTQHSIFSRPILIRIREYEWPASSSLRTRAQDTGVRAPFARWHPSSGV